jgi:hypothetical protein
MALHNVTEAAKLVGKSRRTIQRHMKDGKLSSKKDANGNPTIETSELIRQFGELSQNVTPEKFEKSHLVAPSDPRIDELLESQKKLLERIETLTEEVSRLRRIEHKTDEEKPTPKAKADPKITSIMDRLKAKL